MFPAFLLIFEQKHWTTRTNLVRVIQRHRKPSSLDISWARAFSLNNNILGPLGRRRRRRRRTGSWKRERSLVCGESCCKGAWKREIDDPLADERERKTNELPFPQRTQHCWARFLFVFHKPARSIYKKPTGSA